MTMTLREAVEKSNILCIDGRISSRFSVGNNGLTVSGPNWNSFLNAKGLDNAVYHPKAAAWESACGWIECRYMINIMDAKEMGVKI